MKKFVLYTLITFTFALLLFSCSSEPREISKDLLKSDTHESSNQSKCEIQTIEPEKYFQKENFDHLVGCFFDEKDGALQFIEAVKNIEQTHLDLIQEVSKKQQLSLHQVFEFMNQLHHVEISTLNNISQLITPDILKIALIEFNHKNIAPIDSGKLNQLFNLYQSVISSKKFKDFLSFLLVEMKSFSQSDEIYNIDHFKILINENIGPFLKFISLIDTSGALTLYESGVKKYRLDLSLFFKDAIKNIYENNKSLKDLKSDLVEYSSLLKFTGVKSDITLNIDFMISLLDQINSSPFLRVLLRKIVEYIHEEEVELFEIIQSDFTKSLQRIKDEDLGYFINLIPTRVSNIERVLDLFLNERELIVKIFQTLMSDDHSLKLMKSFYKVFHFKIDDGFVQLLDEHDFEALSYSLSKILSSAAPMLKFIKTREYEFISSVFMKNSEYANQNSNSQKKLISEQSLVFERDHALSHLEPSFYKFLSDSKSIVDNYYPNNTGWSVIGLIGLFEIFKDNGVIIPFKPDILYENEELILETIDHFNQSKIHQHIGPLLMKIDQFLLSSRSMNLVRPFYEGLEIDFRSLNNWNQSQYENFIQNLSTYFHTLHEGEVSDLFDHFYKLSKEELSIKYKYQNKNFDMTLTRAQALELFFKELSFDNCFMPSMVINKVLKRKDFHKSLSRQKKLLSMARLAQGALLKSADIDLKNRTHVFQNALELFDNFNFMLTPKSTKLKKVVADLFEVVSHSSSSEARRINLLSKVDSTKSLGHAINFIAPIFTKSYFSQVLGAFNETDYEIVKKRIPIIFQSKNIWNILKLVPLMNLSSEIIVKILKLFTSLTNEEFNSLMLFIDHFEDISKFEGLASVLDSINTSKLDLNLFEKSKFVRKLQTSGLSRSEFLDFRDLFFLDHKERVDNVLHAIHRYLIVRPITQ